MVIIAATNVGNNSASIEFLCNIEKKEAKFRVRAFVDSFYTNKEYVEFADAVDEYKRLAAMVDETQKGADNNA